jgi:hypothetical protein
MSSEPHVDCFQNKLSLTVILQNILFNMSMIIYHEYKHGLTIPRCHFHLIQIFLQVEPGLPNSRKIVTILLLAFAGKCMHVVLYAYLVIQSFIYCQQGKVRHLKSLDVSEHHRCYILLSMYKITRDYLSFKCLKPINKIEGEFLSVVGHGGNISKDF